MSYLDINLMLKYNSENECKVLLNYDIIYEFNGAFYLNKNFNGGDLDLFDYNVLPIKTETARTCIDHYINPCMLAKSQIMLFLKKNQQADYFKLQNIVDDVKFFDQAIKELLENEFIILNGNKVIYRA
ncbi:hypothetical protein EDEG_03241 [Edhazardia aedis USNM 41457]|uniref:Uncharacterized protein n=1 Tax=Edhazardia aedis (strain USNM 41457) TaxID=1003232 RepID=J9D459_EDHAE|nr:hypothetical protein EDEG_03241 [Edhazardia aedis USNM 41457]|eukprot:EJW02339.1 hypothetical protein EDEG_03241 [Edhazardia aedis USNM 41457]